MGPFHLQPQHLDHLRDHLTVLVTRLETNCDNANDASVRREFEGLSAFAHDLLDKVILAEQALTERGGLQVQLEERFAQGQQSIRAAQERLARRDDAPA